MKVQIVYLITSTILFAMSLITAFKGDKIDFIIAALWLSLAIFSIYAIRKLRGGK